MAVIRIIDSVFQPIINRCILTVDVFTSDDPDNGSHTYIIVAENKDLLTQEAMQKYIEDNILSQRTALPDWTGSSWKSMRV